MYPDALTPAVCRWTAYLVGVPFFALLVLGVTLEFLLSVAFGFGPTRVMTHPVALAAFGVLMLGFAASFLGRRREWVGWLRGKKPAARRPNAVVVFYGLFCLANGIALVVGALLTWRDATAVRLDGDFYARHTPTHKG